MAFSRVILCPRLLTPSSRSSAFVSSGRWIPWMSLSLKVSLYWAMFMESNQPHTSSQSHSNTGFSKNGCLKDNIIHSKNLYKTQWRKWSARLKSTWKEKWTIFHFQWLISHLILNRKCSSVFTLLVRSYGLAEKPTVKLAFKQEGARLWPQSLSRKRSYTIPREKLAGYN